MQTAVPITHTSHQSDFTETFNRCQGCRGITDYAERKKKKPQLFWLCISVSR
nr:unnamed protein product [Callosobruchus chinensis]